MNSIHLTTRSALLLSLMLFSPIVSVAHDNNTVRYQACSSEQKEGDTCLMTADNVLLRPTQPNVGVMKVQCNYYKFTQKSADQMEKYLNEYDHHIPAIIGPDGNFYLTDHHHISAGLLLTQQQGQQTSWHLRIDVLKTFYNSAQKVSDEDMIKFWQYMVDSNFAYLYDNGQPITWKQLPPSLATMTDDPYRTQAGLQKENSLQGFIKPANNPMFFLEFRWGNLMRSNQILGIRPADIPVCKLSAAADKLWYKEGNSCAQQADLQRAMLQSAYKLITSSDAAVAMLPQCMNSMEGVSELCGYHPNAAYPYSHGVKITEECKIKPDD